MNDIIANDFEQLHERINKEFQRRNIPTSINDTGLAKLYQEFNSPADYNNWIYTEHGEKTINLLLKICANNHGASAAIAGDIIYDLTPVWEIVNDLESYDMEDGYNYTKQGRKVIGGTRINNSGCKAVCMGLCNGSCYGNCNGGGTN